MCNQKLFTFIFLVCLFFINISKAQQHWTKPYNIVWNTKSKNSSESMPCGGGNIGLNVWVEKNELLIYIDRSGNIDENDQELKSGRIRVKLDPNPFYDSTSFKQELNLITGCVELKGKGMSGKIWVEVKRPIIHIEMETEQRATMYAAYESWRLEKHLIPQTLDNKGEKAGWDYNRWSMFGYFWYDCEVFAYPDSVNFLNNSIQFFHRNNNNDLMFDKEIKLMRLERSSDKLVSPSRYRIFGGIMQGDNMISDDITKSIYAGTPYQSWLLKSKSPSTKNHIRIFLNTTQSSKQDDWQKQLNELISSRKNKDAEAWKENIEWWNAFWDRSHIIMNPTKSTSDTAWQIARNYTLFRYQLACNVNGEMPTRFNGGLFTFDPVFIDNKNADPNFYNPDFRAWGAWTAQNQRLVHWPMLKNGDFDLMKPQFDFYKKNLPNAKARTFDSWGIDGCSFCEQISSSGLPLGSHYGWEPPCGKRSPNKEQGLSDLHATYYTSQLEFAFMIHELYRFTENDISEYVQFLKQSVIFHFEYFMMLQKRRTNQPFDEKGLLNIEPSHALETYHGKNATDVICALKTNLERLISLPDKWVSADEKKKFNEWLTLVPPINYRLRNGYKTISPLEEDTKKISNYELPQLYPVFPWSIYSIGKPNLDIAINTWRYGVDYWDKPNDTTWYPAKDLWFGWTQQAILLARMGLTDEAKNYLVKKLCDARGNNDFNSPVRMRFPSFWGPGFDWTPDHNWGGSGMIALQEMLMQTIDDRIFILPAWPKEWDVDFKLHAPKNTIVECIYKNGKIEKLNVIPESRKKDVIVLINK